MKVKTVIAHSSFGDSTHTFVLMKAALVEENNHYAAKRSQFRKLFSQPARRTGVFLRYGIHGTRKGVDFDPKMARHERTAYRTDTSLVFGCMTFRGADYRRLRSWATRKA